MKLDDIESLCRIKKMPEMLRNMPGIHLAVSFSWLPSIKILLTVTHYYSLCHPRPFGNPWKKMICSRTWSQDKICPSILKQNSNREAYWLRDLSSWNSYVNTFPLSVSPSNYSQDAGDDSRPIETSNAGINLTLWCMIPAPVARPRKHWGAV